jgi:hypothetical protein
MQRSVVQERIPVLRRGNSLTLRMPHSVVTAIVTRNVCRLHPGNFCFKRSGVLSSVLSFVLLILHKALKARVGFVKEDEEEEKKLMVIVMMEMIKSKTEIPACHWMKIEKNGK